MKNNEMNKNNKVILFMLPLPNWLLIQGYSGEGKGAPDWPPDPGPCPCDVLLCWPPAAGLGWPPAPGPGPMYAGWPGWPGAGTELDQVPPPGAGDPEQGT